MRARIRTSVLVLLILASGGALSGPSSEVLPVDDWAVEAVEAQRTGHAILILFSTKYCAYCERLKAEVLEPQVRAGTLRNFVGIRELDIARGGKIRDFDGEKIRTKIFVKRYGVYATPTLLLVDSQGNPLGTPIVGFNNPEDYMAYLEDLVEVVQASPQLASAQLGSPRTPESF
jgi:thioredoxin-related protein